MIIQGLNMLEEFCIMHTGPIWSYILLISMACCGTHTYIYIYICMDPGIYIYGSGPTGHTWGPTLLGAHVHHGHDRQQCWWQDCLERASGEEPHRRFPPTQGPRDRLAGLESTLQGIGSKDHDFVTILTCCPRGLGWLMVSTCSHKLYHLLVAILWVKPARFNETNLRMSQRSRFERLPVQCLFLPILQTRTGLPMPLVVWLSLRLFSLTPRYSAL